jgi:hypothetical protein
VKELTSSDPMPWGDHKGKPLGEVPVDYLRKLLSEPWIVKWPFIHRYLMRVRSTWPKEERAMWESPLEGFDSYEDYSKWK